METRPNGWGNRDPPEEGLAQTVDRDKDLTLKLSTVGIELSAIISVADAQIDVLHSLRKLRLRKGPEQWRTVGKTIDMVIESRELFRKTIKDILNDLQASQQLVDNPPICLVGTN